MLFLLRWCLFRNSSLHFLLIHKSTFLSLSSRISVLRPILLKNILAGSSTISSSLSKTMKGQKRNNACAVSVSIALIGWSIFSTIVGVTASPLSVLSPSETTVKPCLTVTRLTGPSLLVWPSLSTSSDDVRSSSLSLSCSFPFSSSSLSSSAVSGSFMPVPMTLVSR